MPSTAATASVGTKSARSPVAGASARLRRLRRSCGATVGLLLCALFAPAIEAAEGASSGYLQGTFNDFQMGVFGPSGVYLRNDLALYDADIGARPLGGRVAASSDQTTWIDIVKLVWLTDHELLGARYGAAVTLPLVLNADVGGALTGPGFGVFRRGDVSGTGDLYVNPVLLNWSHGRHNITFAPAIVVPTGKYDPERLLNTGRNYWSLDLAGAYSWFHPERGHELSLSAGVLFNAENPDTDYRTGTELHLDWLVGQYLSERFAVAATGYWYQQIEGDDGTVTGPIRPSDFKGSGWGLGPAILYNLKVADTSVSIIGKALFDVDSSKRYEGNLYMLSAAFKF